MPELSSTIPRYISSAIVVTIVIIDRSLLQYAKPKILIITTKNKTTNTIVRIGVDRIFRTKNKIGSADSKYSVTSIGERTKKSFRYKPSKRLYVSAIAKKMILDLVLVLDVFVVFISNLLLCTKNL